MLTIGDTFPAITVPVQQGTNALPKDRKSVV